MIHILRDAEFFQRQDATDSKQYFLLQTVLPVAAVECMRDGTVVLRVEFIVRIQQIKFDTTHIHLPHVSVHLIIYVRHVDDKGRSVFVEELLHGKRMEILCLVVGNLFASHTETLRKVAVTVEKSDGTHVNIAVGRFFQIVACQNAQTAAVNLQHLVETVLHTEISHAGT